jgi:response regulator RpfG family c-di-GMP phosphodiesterase
MNAKVLFVDDDSNLLASLRRQFRNDFPLETAMNAEEGLMALSEKGPFAVVVSDMRMPGLSGNEFLGLVHRAQPDCARILLTGYAELQTAIDSVNRGHVFRFLTKPCDPVTLKNAIMSGLEQHRLITAQRDLLENTVRGSVKVLSDVLSLTNPRAFGKSSRLRKLISSLVVQLKLTDPWKYDVAAMLALLGCVSIPEQVLAILDQGGRLALEEEEMVRNHPKVGYDLLHSIPRFEEIAEMIRYQHRRYDGWDDTKLTHFGEAIPIGARMLKVALDYDHALQRGNGPRGAFLEIEKNAKQYDPTVVDALREIVGQYLPGDTVKMHLRDLKIGMIIADGLFNKFGTKLMPEGLEVTTAVQSRVRNMSVVEPFNVILPSTLGAELAEAVVVESRRELVAG